VFAPQGEIATVDPSLTLTDSARVGGDLTYTSSTEARISHDAQIRGRVERTERPPQEEPARTLTDTVLGILRNFIALVLVGLLLLWVMPDWTRRLSDTVQARPLPSFGWGILGFMVFIALAIAILLAVIFGLLALGSLVLLLSALALAEVVLVRDSEGHPGAWPCHRWLSRCLGLEPSPAGSGLCSAVGQPIRQRRAKKRASVETSLG
jgi:hypothetical protein